jgi:tetratricopeptide (TPR) repeat protein
MRRHVLTLSVIVLTAAITVPQSAAKPSSPDPRCAAADALNEAGAIKAAQAAYVKALSRTPALKCASDGLKKLTTSDESFSKKAKDWLTNVTGALALLATLLLIVAGFFGLVFVLLTYWWLTRKALAKTPFIKRLFRPRLGVVAFKDGGEDPAVGAGVTALVRMHLRRLSESSTQTRDRIILDRVTGTEQISSAIKGLGDVAPQLKALTALLSAVPQLARLPRYAVTGTVQAAGTWGAGITVILDEQHLPGAATTLWAWKPPSGTGTSSSGTGTPTSDAATYHALAAGAASWADFELRRRQRMSRPSWTTEPDSYAYTRVGDALELQGHVDDARVVYERALGLDPANVGAVINLAGLQARGRNLEETVELLEYAADVLEQESA